MQIVFIEWDRCGWNMDSNFKQGKEKERCPSIGVVDHDHHIDRPGARARARTLELVANKEWKGLLKISASSSGYALHLVVVIYKF